MYNKPNTFLFPIKIQFLASFGGLTANCNKNLIALVHCEGLDLNDILDVLLVALLGPPPWGYLLPPPR